MGGGSGEGGRAVTYNGLWSGQAGDNNRYMSPHTLPSPMLCFALLSSVSHDVALTCFVVVNCLCVGLLCFALLCFASFLLVLLCFPLLCLALLCFYLLCFILLRFSLPCFAFLCFAMLRIYLHWFALLCFAFLSFTLLGFFCFA